MTEQEKKNLYGLGAEIVLRLAKVAITYSNEYGYTPEETLAYLGHALYQAGTYVNAVVNHDGDFDTARRECIDIIGINKTDKTLN